jgi:hypothetical protein
MKYLTMLAMVCALVATQGLGRAASAPTVDEVLARHYRARGGLDKIRAIRSVVMRGVYKEGDFESATFIEWKRPSSRVVGLPPVGYYEGFDGTTWELSTGDGKIRRPDGAAAAAGRRGAEFDESIVDYASKGHTVSLGAGTRKVAGREAYEVVVRLADGWEKVYYIDAQSYLVVALRKAMPLHATGPDVESLTVYEDHRAVAGVLYPHRGVEYRTATGAVMNTLQWDEIRANVELGDERFHPEFWLKKN